MIQGFGDENVDFLIVDVHVFFNRVEFRIIYLVEMNWETTVYRSIT